MGKLDLFGDYAMLAIRDQIVKDTCADLKARVMEIIEPQIDEAVNRAVMSMKMHLHAHADLAAGASILKVVIQRKEQK
jgi:uncharacterized protein (DUF885 family)